MLGNTYRMDGTALGANERLTPRANPARATASGDRRERRLSEMVGRDARKGREMLKKAQVTFEVKAPVEATADEVREWIAFNLGARQDMKCENPLSDFDMEPTRGSVAMMITNA